MIGNKNVGLAADSLNDPTATAYNLRELNWLENGKPQPPLDFYANGRGESSDVGLYTRLRMPIAVFPERANPRIARQTGVFTLHGGKIPQRPETALVHDDAIGRPITIEEIEAMEPQNDVQARTWRRIVKWLFIPKGKRAGIRKTLAQIGISEASLFPELDYQSRHLRGHWTNVRAKS